MSYIEIPFEVATDPRLQGPALGVYVAIRLSIDTNNLSYPGLREISTRSGYAVNTVEAAIVRLHAAGAVRVEMRGKGRHQYRFPPAGRSYQPLTQDSPPSYQPVIHIVLLADTVFDAEARGGVVATNTERAGSVPKNATARELEELEELDQPRSQTKQAITAYVAGGLGSRGASMERRLDALIKRFGLPAVLQAISRAIADDTVRFPLAWLEAEVPRERRRNNAADRRHGGSEELSGNSGGDAKRKEEERQTAWLRANEFG